MLSSLITYYYHMNTFNASSYIYELNKIDTCHHVSGLFVYLFIYKSLHCLRSNCIKIITRVN